MKATKDIPNLDFLRSVAVLLVFARHIVSESTLETANILWFKPQVLGIMGVFLFFVHTSLVLMFSLDRTWKAKSIGSNVVTFYIRRFFRIYPLSILAVLTIAFFLIPVFGAKSLAFNDLDLKGVFANLLLVQNITHHPDIIGVLWSLPLEVQMYLTLPFLFLFAKKFHVKHLVYIWIGSVGLSVLSVYCGFPYNLVKYIPCFIPGIIAFKLWDSQKRLPFVFLPIAIFALASYYMLSYGILGSSKETGLGYPICISIGFLLPFLKELKWKPLVYSSKVIATYSYGIYLSHSIVNRFVFGRVNIDSFLVLTCLSAVLTLAVSACLFHLIEQPFIKAGSKVIERLRSRSVALKPSVEQAS